MLLLALALSAPPVDDAFFESKVRPLLTAHCTTCHGPAKQKGGLRLDARKAALAGGDTGPAFVPGDAAKSLLVAAVRYDGDLKMPPKGKLTADEIDTLSRWVAGGAPWPDAAGVTVAGPKGFDVKAVAAGHWAYKPVTTTASTGSIDDFIRSKLDAAGLKPAAEADRTTLIRRLTFDLTGLPPTPTEIDAFVSDKSANAYEKLVDRLLASPHYGERWGRHWLDLVRYADTYGHEFDFEIPDIWRYRDYVIAAFNDDLPFDRFAREQIAGDRIPTPRRDPKTGGNLSAVGTGFWLLGESKHSPVDVRQDQADRIDNMIDVFGKTFFGHTVACARCHDHKFDPVSAKDYYALYGILSSSRPTRTWLCDDKPATVSAKWAGWSLDGPAFPLPVGEHIDSGRTGEHAGGAGRSPTFRISTKVVAVRVAGKHARLRLVLDGLQLIQAPIYGGLARTIDNDDFRWVGIDVSMWPGHAAYLELIDDGPGYFVLDEVRFADAVPTDKPTPGPKSTATATKSPPRAFVMADGTGLNERVFVRGNHKSLGEEAPRRFLELFAGTAGVTDGSGRKELADAVTDPANPLTARVFVNRVWLHHFGTGLVPTPDDFGRQGTPPTHPELLDALAAEFVRDGWKVKALHRRILLSATYRMASRPHPDTADRAQALDPQNRLLHWMNVRRLEAEAIRDAMLVVSGRLDRTVGGPGVMPYLTEHMVGRGRPGASGPLDGDGRRSVYLQTRRNFLNPMLTAFDFPTPFTTIGRRGVSNVPAQGLVMLNNPFVRGQAETWAKRESGDPADRVRRMYRSAFGRMPSAEEVTTATTFVADHPGDGWAALAHALFNAKEFVFVE